MPVVLVGESDPTPCQDAPRAIDHEAGLVVAKREDPTSGLVVPYPGACRPEEASGHALLSGEVAARRLAGMALTGRRRPGTRPVQHGEHLDFLPGDTVRHHEWRARHYQLTRAVYPTRPAAFWELPQAFYGVADVSGRPFRRPGPFRSDVGPRFFEVGDGLPGVADKHRQRA
jgi:hypothetical protein